MKKALLVIAGSLVGALQSNAASAQVKVDGSGLDTDKTLAMEALRTVHEAGLLQFEPTTGTYLVDTTKVAQQFGPGYVDQLINLTNGKVNIKWTTPSTMSLGGQEGVPNQ